MKTFVANTTRQHSSKDVVSGENRDNESTRTQKWEARRCVRRFGRRGADGFVALTDGYLLVGRTHIDGQCDLELVFLQAQLTDGGFEAGRHQNAGVASAGHCFLLFRDYFVVLCANGHCTTAVPAQAPEQALTTALTPPDIAARARPTELATPWQRPPDEPVDERSTKYLNTMLRTLCLRPRAAALRTAFPGPARPPMPPHAPSPSSSTSCSFSSTPARRKKAAPMPPRPKPPPEGEIEESFLKGSGPGGQKINKTNSAVQLKHGPTRLVVKCQATRSRTENRKIARQLLADKLDDLARGGESRSAVVGEAKRKKRASAAKKKRRKYRKLEGDGAAAATAAGEEGEEGEEGIDLEVESEIEEEVHGRSETADDSHSRHILGQPAKEKAPTPGDGG
ncbi:hypothetical protein JX265_003969 [Neoarthrinium moseri]|uniref:Prokaryotic-type class I peptide chain release factors domain-containing protein n=1 Tax=Neoarthrinium moseri TaxID=1658444 RepID=A0A9Q0ARW6_9PEZI|nr:hypothetical protein JX265_003969 [Neoarthrinium moseri]